MSATVLISTLQWKYMMNSKKILLELSEDENIWELSSHYTSQMLYQKFGIICEGTRWLMRASAECAFVLTTKRYMRGTVESADHFDVNCVNLYCNGRRCATN